MSKKKRNRTITAPTRDELPNTRIIGDPRVITSDAFANSLAKLGIDQQNLSAGGTYNFNPLSRDRMQLENAYRGSWIVRQAVDVIPEDMCREGIKIKCDLPPDAIDKFYVSFSKKGIWREIARGLRWARLYGGSIVLLQIDGQDNSTPLRLETIGKSQFKGLRALDRWMVQPTLSEGETITEPGPKQGLPAGYDIVVESAGLPRGRVHHSRVIRFDGNDLPFFQRQMENGWGLSVLEPLWDRLMAFDSTTTGAAQLVFKAHLRTVYIDGFHQAASVGGPAYEGIKRRLNAMAIFQSSEGMSVMDSKEKLETTAYTFGGLDSVLVQFSQQLSGALGIPLVRLFGQSPAGLNATGDADIRNFYDKIKELQETGLREPLDLILACEHQSQYAAPPGDDFGFEFSSLWQLNDNEKAQIGAQTTTSVVSAFSAGVIDKSIAMKELNQSSDVTGLWSNITDEDIEAAAMEPPPMPGLDPSGGLGGPLPTTSRAPPSPGGSSSGAPPVASGGAPSGSNPGLEALHAAVKGKDLTGNPAPPSTLRGMIGLKSAHELELLHYNTKGESLSGPKPANGLMGPDLEDLHNRLRGKSLTGDAANFDPNQPRDKIGEWTSGGAAESSAERAEREAYERLGEPLNKLAEDRYFSRAFSDIPEISVEKVYSRQSRSVYFNISRRDNEGIQVSLRVSDHPNPANKFEVRSENDRSELTDYDFRSDRKGSDWRDTVRKICGDLNVPVPARIIKDIEGRTVIAAREEAEKPAVLKSLPIKISAEKEAAFKAITIKNEVERNKFNELNTEARRLCELDLEDFDKRGEKGFALREKYRLIARQNLGLLNPNLEDLHEKIRGKSLTGDAEFNEADHPRDKEGKWADGFHGTRTSLHDYKGKTPLYLTNNEEQAFGYARGVHIGGSGTGNPHVKVFKMAPGNILNIDDAISGADDYDEAINEEIKKALSAKSVRYLEYSHPNAGSQGEHDVRISLYPDEDLSHVGTHHRLRPRPGTKDANSRNEIIQKAQLIPHDQVKAAMKSGLSYEAAMELYGWHQPEQVTTRDNFNPEEPSDPKVSL